MDAQVTSKRKLIAVVVILAVLGFVVTYHPSNAKADRVLQLLTSKYGFETSGEPSRLTFPVSASNWTRYRRSITLERIDMDEIAQDVLSECESCSIERISDYRAVVTLPSDSRSEISITLVDPSTFTNSNIGSSFTCTRPTLSEMSLLERLWNRLMQFD